MDTASRVESREELGLNLRGGKSTHLGKEQGSSGGEDYCLDLEFKSGLSSKGELKGP